MSDDPLTLLRDHLDRRRTVRDVAYRGADLRGAQLRQLRADALDLEDADLRGAAFASARWTGCKLRGARLDEADFAEAALLMCDLDEVRASKAVFAKARLENSTACGATFDAADLRGATLTDTDFARASFRGANLQRVEASGVNLRGADLRDADLTDADLTQADLRGADLTGARLDGADLQGADLRGAIGGPDQPAESSEEDAAAPMPEAWKPLADTMTPIVQEILRTAGRRGTIDSATAARMLQSFRGGGKPQQHLPLETINAVSRVLNELGDDILPSMLAAMRQDGGEPPAAVQELIRRLGEELAMPEDGTTEDLVERMSGNPKKSNEPPTS